MQVLTPTKSGFISSENSEHWFSSKKGGIIPVNTNKIYFFLKEKEKQANKQTKHFQSKHFETYFCYFTW